MTRSRARYRFPAWLALLATLFSAVSPAIAASVLTDRPAALARMLGLPGSAAAPAEETCDEHTGAGHAQEVAGTAHHGDAPASDGKAHGEHGIYCSFCLTASSTAAVMPVPPALVLANSAEVRLAVPPALLSPAAHRFVFHSRAPPAAPVLPA
jgi:hypothetical protein